MRERGESSRSDLMCRPPQVIVFQLVRWALALLCALCESVFYRACVHRFGKRIGRYVLVGLLFSVAMFHAGSGEIGVGCALGTTRR